MRLLEREVGTVVQRSWRSGDSASSGAGRPCWVGCSLDFKEKCAQHRGEAIGFSYFLKREGIMGKEASSGLAV